MTEAPVYPPTRRVVLAIVAFIGGLFLAAIISIPFLNSQGWQVGVSAAAGSEAGRTAMQFGTGLPLDDFRPPGVAFALLNLPLTIGLIGVPLLDRLNGLDWRRDLGWSMRAIDVPLGVAIGVATQFALIPLYELIWLVFDERDVGQAADDIVAHIDGPLDTLAIIVMVAVMAPVSEEIVYRGLLYRGVRDMEASHHGRAVALAVIVSSALFAISHFQFVLLPGLFLFGVVAAVLFQRTGRLGTAIWAHVGFNATTLVFLLS